MRKLAFKAAQPPKPKPAAATATATTTTTRAMSLRSQTEHRRTSDQCPIFPQKRTSNRLIKTPPRVRSRGSKSE
jgi:hypothetical protein